jgi:hypothetical protein
MPETTPCASLSARNASIPRGYNSPRRLRLAIELAAAASERSRSLESGSIPAGCGTSRSFSRQVLAEGNTGWDGSAN